MAFPYNPGDVVKADDLNYLNYYALMKKDVFSGNIDYSHLEEYLLALKEDTSVYDGIRTISYSTGGSSVSYSYPIITQDKTLQGKYVAYLKGYKNVSLSNGTWTPNCQNTSHTSCYTGDGWAKLKQTSNNVDHETAYLTNTWDYDISDGEYIIELQFYSNDNGNYFYTGAYFGIGSNTIISTGTGNDGGSLSAVARVYLKVSGDSMSGEYTLAKSVIDNGEVQKTITTDTFNVDKGNLFVKVMLYTDRDTYWEVYSGIKYLMKLGNDPVCSYDKETNTTSIHLNGNDVLVGKVFKMPY